ncbi:universal stress protein [Geopsychrobacter electrodiphilus]|uniref:universal stress protein n=1 Tax=Geopsychrobacter electrodiphilus TaxID=225196 RepID=UPI000381A93C|nr:universal stress protein [Geopsychrobacter electrodiphilus]
MLPEIKNILYATDLSSGSTHVFRYALSLARRYQAQVSILHVVEPLTTFGQSLVELHISHQVSENLHAEIRTQLLDKLKERLRSFCEQEACATEENLVADILVLEGRPAATIIEQARVIQADIIVMGTHQHSAVGEALLGTTAHKVLHSSALPTLLIRIPK